MAARSPIGSKRTGFGRGRGLIVEDGGGKSWLKED